MRLNLNELDISWRAVVALMGLTGLILLVAAKGRDLINVPRQLYVHDSTAANRDKQEQILRELQKMNCYTFNDHTRGNWRTCEEGR